MMTANRRFRIGVVGALLIGLCGTALIIAAAVSHRQATTLTEQDIAERAATGELTEQAPSRDGERTADVPDSAVPGGIVRLPDPNWVVRVSEASGIPTRALTAYAGADIAVRDELGCEVGWNTLAAIGSVESQHGTLQGGEIESDYVARPDIVGIPLDGTSTARIADTDDGVIDGDTEWDRAVGPMQFIPETWERWGRDGDGDGERDIHNIADAALTAAHYLCAAHGTLGDGTAWIGAIRSYNDSVDYQNDVASRASEYASLDDSPRP